MKGLHVSAVLALCAALAGCATPQDTPAKPTASATTATTKDPNTMDFEYASVKGGFGEAPTITLKEDQPSPGDLVIEDIVVGDGDVVAPGATVKVNYEGVSWINKGTVFDSSFKRGEPISFSLSQVISGWSQGLVGQKVGGRRLLVIPPQLAYGNQSPTPDIAVNDTLVFVVDLLEVSNP